MSLNPQCFDWVEEVEREEKKKDKKKEMIGKIIHRPSSSKVEVKRVKADVHTEPKSKEKGFGVVDHGLPSKAKENKIPGVNLEVSSDFLS